MAYLLLPAPLVWEVDVTVVVVVMEFAELSEMADYENVDAAAPNVKFLDIIYLLIHIELIKLYYIYIYIYTRMLL